MAHLSVMSSLMSPRVRRVGPLNGSVMMVLLCVIISTNHTAVSREDFIFMDQQLEHVYSRFIDIHLSDLSACLGQTSCRCVFFLNCELFLSETSERSWSSLL